MSAARSLRRAAAVAACVVAAAGGPAAPARASSPTAYECEFDGTWAEFSPGIQTLGGPGGGYMKVEGPVACTVHKDGAVVRVRGSIWSYQGTFQSSVCGTGSFVSGWETWIRFDDWTLDFVDLSFQAEMVGGAGDLRFSTATKADGVEYTGAGAFALVPTYGDCTLYYGILRADVHGAFTLVPK
jgi:hypothetical protein